ncbi:1742_t:CDS:2 [Funneliformis geosporum]|uniref:1426_t:CDS:1 n=1 Tax=Funneliformis geosporum TaxID=1117311 RepID=A0A9W4SRL3_9GLOM|nr:1742_t:CDS:2 [Funneliformis geosporum]CAI2178028.1 1426_t:CDS:2 [Funneliformis geosporum]
MQNDSTLVPSIEGHCPQFHIKTCDNIELHRVIYSVSIVLGVILAITAGGLWLKRRIYIESSQRVAFLDGYLLWQTMHALIRIISDIIILSNLIEEEFMVLELVYDIPFYCDQVSVILFILGILLAIPPSRTSPNSQRTLRNIIPSHNSIIWFFRIFSFIFFPSLAILALLTGYFHSMWNAKPDEDRHYKDLETHMIRAHYIVYAISCVLLAICFAYFGRKVKGFAECSIGLLMGSEMDSRYHRLRLMRRSITRMNIVNGFLCAKYLLFAIAATIAAFQLVVIFSHTWIAQIAVILVINFPLVSMILCTLLILYGDTNPEKAFDTDFSDMSHLPHKFLTWNYTVESSNQQSDKNELNLLPPPPSYKDDNINQQYVKEIERIPPPNINCCSDASNSTNNRTSGVQNSSTILPNIIISSPPEISIAENRPSLVVGKSKFIAAWILDQHERTSTKEMTSLSEDNNQGCIRY